MVRIKAVFRPVKADVPDRLPDHLVGVDMDVPAGIGLDLSGDHDHAGGSHSLDGDVSLRVLGKVGI
jgi:hypothetical protein